MPHTQAMLQTHPRPTQIDRAAVQACIDACYECASACTMCADVCLGERDLGMLIRCIRLNLDGADVCATPGALVARQTEPDWGVIRAQLRACIAACRACGQECEQHGRHGMEHCRICAEACRRCEDACNRLLQAIPAGNGARATA